MSDFLSFRYVKQKWDCVISRTKRLWFGLILYTLNARALETIRAQNTSDGHARRINSQTSKNVDGPESYIPRVENH